MSYSESDTRAKLIDPAIHARGWTEEMIRREETAGAIEISEGKAYKRGKGRVDYCLRVKVNQGAQPVAVGIIEAKAENLPPNHGLEQAKLYAACKRLNVPFVFSSNGHLFVEYERWSGLTSDKKPLAEFPTPTELRERYETGMGFGLGDAAAKPLLARYSGGEATRRYYQDAAMRAVFEKLARCERLGEPKRALLSLATGAGKTFIAVQLLKRSADAGQLRKALFVCDRTELRDQGLGAFQNVFGADAAEVSSDKPQKNARILIATYQTLDVDQEGKGGTFLSANYPENYFSHIIIDECHRSAWGEWSMVLKRNPGAVQIGLTATPREFTVTESSKEALQDLEVSGDNLRYFGEPVYEYNMAQGIEDGYLAACQVVRRNIYLAGKAADERETGIDRDDIKSYRILDPITGEVRSAGDVRPHYDPSSFEDNILLPTRMDAMCRDLFAQLLATGGPHQKTIIFCVRDQHADDVAAEMNNLYAAWCAEQGQERLEPYAFKCTASVGGAGFVKDLKGAVRSHFIATTVELLSTGVDVPVVRNIVFFKYVRSPIAFQQMVGRGTRLDPASGKLMFRVYDYTDATRLFGALPPQAPPGEKREPPEASGDRQPLLEVEDVPVLVTPAGTLIVTSVDGTARPVTVEEYRQILSQTLVAEAPTLEEFRRQWIDPARRSELMSRLPDGGRAPLIIKTLDGMGAYDLYDVLADLGYGLAPRTRAERAEAFAYKHEGWLAEMPAPAAATLRALSRQFARAGTEGLENPQVFSTPEVSRAGGLRALKALGSPAQALAETKERMFAA